MRDSQRFAETGKLLAQDDQILFIPAGNSIKQDLTYGFWFFPGKF